PLFRSRAGGRRRRVVVPVHPFMPVVAHGFAGVLGAVGAIAAHHRIRRAVPVAAPANAFGVRRIEWKFLGHGRVSPLRKRYPSILIGLLGWGNDGCQKLSTLYTGLVSARRPRALSTSGFQGGSAP